MSVIAGAIRWDAWYSQLGDAGRAQNSLGPQQWQFRAPWFAEVISSYQIAATGTQADIDAEIGYAAGSGLKFWAFDQYAQNGGDSMLLNAWSLYQASPSKSDINWCWIAVSDSLFGVTDNFSTQVAQYVDWFQQPNYQKVLSGRPLLFLDFTSVTSRWGNSAANFAAMIAALRAATVAVGLSTPYIVVMGWIPASPNFMTAIGADAISGYIGPPPSGQPVAYAAMDESVQGFWAQMANNASEIIPIAQMGWDIRPRIENPVPWEEPGLAPYVGMLNYVSPGLVTERAKHLQAAVNYVGANPTKCPSSALLIYSWTECDEGGGALIPTLGDPPINGTTNILSAVRAVLQ